MRGGQLKGNGVGPGDGMKPGREQAQAQSEVGNALLTGSVSGLKR